MPTAKTSDPLALRDALNADGVEYLVVGGAESILTADFDCCTQRG